MPDLPYDKLLENCDKLREENKNLNKKIEKLEQNQKFIGLSFIEDDLDGSKFIDDNCFEKILNELTDDKNYKDSKNYNITMMKFFKSHEDDKDKEGNSKYKNDKKYFYYKREKNDGKKYTIYNNNNNTKSPHKFNTIKSKTDINDNNKETINIDNNDDINQKKFIGSKFRRTYHKSLKTNVDLENDINIDKEKNIYVNLDKKFLRSVKTMKLEEDENILNKEKEQKMISIQEDTIKDNIFYRRRRFFKKK